MNTKKIAFLCASIAFAAALHGQKKLMTPEVYDLWNTIENVQISDNGNWVTYVLEPGKGDSKLVVYNTRSGDERVFDRADKALIDGEELFIAFRIRAAQDSIHALKLKKVKKEKMPHDSLGLLNLKTGTLTKIADVEDFRAPQKSGALLCYSLYERKIKQDSSLVKDEGSENGKTLGLINFLEDSTLLFPYIKHFEWSEKGGQLLLQAMGSDTINRQELMILDAYNFQQKTVSKISGKLSRTALNDDGSKLAFLADRDTSKNEIRPYELFYWESSQDSASLICSGDAGFIDSSWQISPNYTPVFSENGKRLFFGIAPHPLVEDTTILKEEKVEVEVWHYQDPLLYTHQMQDVKQEKERAYEVCYDIESRNAVPLADYEIPEVSVNKKIKGNFTVSYSDRAYQQNISWLGYAFRDVYLTDLTTGKKKLIAKATQGSPSLSPAEKYVYWYSRPDTAWYAYDIARDRLRQLSKGQFYDELNDRPMHPSSNGSMEWTENDETFLVYDQYDIWALDPSGKKEARQMTQGRSSQWHYRYINLNRELEYLPKDTTVLVKIFDESNKSSGYAYLNIATGYTEIIEIGPYNYSTRVYKAKNSQDLLFSKSSFEVFPDLLLSNMDFDVQQQISIANPQQEEYGWGSIELVKWHDADGLEAHGLLVRPADFDPEKKYPMIVNFYERSSHGLHNHREPFPHRSTINYSYYANRGYVIFNPDVRYEVGYPGRSCEKAVMSGVDAVVAMGFVDPDRIGLQGHSWGGYQIAHLVTKTDRFRCAEAGAPVVNMVSAYGGIRWGSGMSRMFQYEQTQSRLGYTLWERPDLYLENSPIFNIDKVNTPVLILHNDKDGAVPWYQGIEYFVAMRRLGKPAWLLNYNDEPHWPVKRHNRLDFNLRLQQFFDHYLMNAPMPEWMSQGIPAVEKGINYGLD